MGSEGVMSVPPQDIGVYEVCQARSATALADIEGTVAAALRQSGCGDSLQPGARIAITAGSRGIANIPTILRVVADFVRESGAEPFLVPAMGTHGGATAEGQVSVLAGMGVTEAAVGAPIRSCMDTTCIGGTPAGTDVRIDRLACQADGIIVVGRVKPHTDFGATIESGLFKMLAVGLGKAEGALLVHSWGTAGLRDIVPQTARVILDSGKVLLGVAILENSWAETAMVEAVQPEDFERRDGELLVTAKQWAPRLPFDEAEVLILRRLGKDISGTGMDAKVIGRTVCLAEGPPPSPRIYVIGVLDLTPGTYGNAVGIGMADLTTERLVDAIDIEAMRKNTMTARSVPGARIPLA
ncbi:MAG: lactate racemase domain-containing protein, partial [Armatimonadota bacterium]